MKYYFTIWFKKKKKGQKMRIWKICGTKSLGEICLGTSNEMESQRNVERTKWKSEKTNNENAKKEKKNCRHKVDIYCSRDE